MWRKGSVQGRDEMRLRSGNDGRGLAALTLRLIVSFDSSQLLYQTFTYCNYFLMKYCMKTHIALIQVLPLLSSCLLILIT